MRIFLDANVLFAAAISPTGRSAALFLLADQGACTLLASPHAIAEARRNVEARYPEATARLGRLLDTVAVVPEASPTRMAWARQQHLPEEDAPILAAAVEARADVLATGDKTHFGRLFGKNAGGVRVLRLADALVLGLGRPGDPARPPKFRTMKSLFPQAFGLTLSPPTPIMTLTPQR